MTKYRKKLVVDAFQMTEERRWDVGNWPKWLEAAWYRGGVGSVESDVFGPGLCIGTLEGVMRVDLDDYIIKGVKDELYPCKPDIFEATYEEVKEQDEQHVIEFCESGWTIQHPLSCRPNLFECEVTKVAQRDLKGTPKEGTGRYTCGVGEYGYFWYNAYSRMPLEE